MLHLVVVFQPQLHVPTITCNVKSVPHNKVKQGMCIMIIVRCLVIIAALVTKITDLLGTVLYYKGY